MYFEAVEEILKKLEDPNLKSTTKANLSRQLKELDPDESIRKFIRKEIDRPDLSDTIGASEKSR